MTSVARRPLPDQPFSIHEDAATDEVETADDPDQQTEEVRAPSEEEEEANAASEDVSEGDESSEEETAAPGHVVRDMEKLGREIPGIKDKYRLIKRIGEGQVSAPSRRRT